MCSTASINNFWVEQPEARDDSAKQISEIEATNQTMKLVGFDLDRKVQALLGRDTGSKRCDLVKPIEDFGEENPKEKKIRLGFIGFIGRKGLGFVSIDIVFTRTVKMREDKVNG